MLASAVEHVPTDSIRAYERKLRRHSDRQVAQIAWAIREFGFNNPIIVDEDGVVVAGHGRLLAALELGLETLPVIRLSHLTPERLRAYRIADNRLSDLGELYSDELKLELKELLALDLNLDPEAMGFNTSELDLVLNAPDAAADADGHARPLPRQQPSPAAAMNSNLAYIGWPALMPWTRRLGPGSWATGWLPWCSPIRPTICKSKAASPGSGKVKHREFEYASGEMSEAEFTTFLTRSFERLAAVCGEGALWYVWMDHRHMFEILSAGRSIGMNMFNLAVWDKLSGGMGSYLRSRHELCFIWKQGTAPHVNNNVLGRYGRNRDNVWSHPGLSSFGPSREADLADHPTVKPLALAVEAIKDCTKRGDIVLDAFLGSGTTILAAERTGRICCGAEIDPTFCDVVIRRWEQRTGVAVRHVGSGLTFAELTGKRQAEAAKGNPAPASTPSDGSLDPSDRRAA